MLKNSMKFFSVLPDILLKDRLVIKRYAGHSKWQNIRHIKGEKDAQKTLLFTKLGRQMKVAVQEGGSIDPKFNAKLAQIIEQTKRASMPMATVQSILKSCQNDKSQSKSYVLEIKGPGSCFILCEVYTSNFHTLKQTIATLLRKHQSKFSEGGGKHMFEQKGIVEAEIPNNVAKNETEFLESATEHAIESGAEDVKIMDKNCVQFTCGSTSLNNVVQVLEQLGYKVTSASVEYVPIKFQQLQDSDLEICGKLFEKLEALPDVVNLSDNIA